MKSMKKLTILTVVFALLTFWGCEKQNALSPINSEYSGTNSSVDFAKPGHAPNPGSYPQFGEATVEYWSPKNFYKGTSINIPNGSNFSISHGALTPPSGIPFGEPVQITMTAEKDSVKNQLIFSFGPSGCQFDPPAAVVFDYTDLGFELATLYYIDENGNYIPQSPDYINISNNKITIYVDHFSRYAIGAE
jgi:hypothetical protein